MTLAQSIGSRLRSAREDAQLSQMKLAEKTSIDKATIHNIERGSNLPGAKTIVALCKALGCSSDWLLGLTEPRDSRPQ